MNRALIIDDEAPARAALRGLLREHLEIKLVGEADTTADAKARLGHEDYDLVFLDVQLRGGTGFDLLAFISADARIIFVTAHDQYAVRAFEVNALDYLLKPVHPVRLAEAIRRLSGSPLEPRTAPVPAPPITATDLVYLKLGNGTTRFIAMNEIAAIESNENYSLACLGDGTRLLVRRTMKSWEERLPATHFVRVHRGTIVNLARYRGADRESYETMLLHIDGLADAVRASFRYLPELRTRLSDLGRQL